MSSMNGEFVEISPLTIQRLRGNQRVGESVGLDFEIALREIQQPFIRNNRRAVDQIDEGDEAARTLAFGDFHRRIVDGLMEKLRITNVDSNGSNGRNGQKIDE